MYNIDYNCIPREGSSPWSIKKPFPSHCPTHILYLLSLTLKSPLGTHINSLFTAPDTTKLLIEVIDEV